MTHVYDALGTKAGIEHSRTQSAISRLVDLYEAWGKSRRVDEKRQQLMQESVVLPFPTT
jgi:hypothetical protein